MSNARAGIAAAFAAALLAAGCGGGGNSTPTSGTPTGTTGGAAAGADVVITIANMSFSPNNVAVKAGQTVAWKNTDAIAHTATQDQGTFDTGMIAAGSTSKPITITSTSALSYHCTVHPGMVATINGTTGTTGPGY